MAAQGGGGLTSTQTATKNYLVFSDFETMDTHVAREAMPPNRLAWCENLQIIGPNQLTTVPAPAAAIANIPGVTASKMWFAFLNGTDYEIVFYTDGSMRAIALPGGGVKLIAGTGTFSNPDVSVWNSVAISVLVIADPVAGYCSWNGTTLSKAGSLSPAFNVIAGGTGYNLGATAAIFALAGSGATASAAVSGAAVNALTLTSGGSGYSAGALVAIVGALATSGAGATGTVNVTAGAVTSINIVDGGAGYSNGQVIYVNATQGIGCFGTATAVGGVLTAVAITAGGANYLQGEIVGLQATVGSGATATATVLNGSVVALNLTAGGAGYAAASVLIQGNASIGSGATATVQTVGGVVTGLTLTNPGVNYQPADAITVVISPVLGGAGAQVAGKVWPQFSITPTTLAVYQGRVWLAGGRQLTWTGTGGLDDASLANASGTTSIPDADLVHRITALRSLNNFLWIFGDNSIKQIGSVSVNGSTTVFSIVTLSSDTGTIYPQTIVSYQRLVLFANGTGVYAVLGASVQKISEEMDGVFRQIDFSVPPCAALNDINNIRCYLLLVRYVDQRLNITRTLLLTFQAKKWFVCSQGNNLLTMATAVLNGTLETFGSSGADLTQLLQNTTTPVAIFLQTALSHHSKPHMGKRALRAATAQQSQSAATINLTIDTENTSIAEAYTVAFPITWRNALNQIVTWTNALAQLVTFVGGGFLFQRTPATGTGVYLGMTLSATVAGYSFNNGIIEYQEATALASKTSA